MAKMCAAAFLLATSIWTPAQTTGVTVPDIPYFTYVFDQIGNPSEQPRWRAIKQDALITQLGATGRQAAAIRSVAERYRAGMETLERQLLVLEGQMAQMSREQYKLRLALLRAAKLSFVRKLATDLLSSLDPDVAAKLKPPVVLP
jgi:hypothetical protein